MAHGGRNGYRLPPHSLNLDLEKKQRIALSFNLENCWFCGRPMTPTSR